jgi:hypothetical protein
VQNLLSFSSLSKNIKNKIYTIVTLPAVLYGYEVWSLTVRKERRLRIFENRVLRRIFGPRREGVIGECRRLRNEELYTLYTSPNAIRVIKSRRMRQARHLTRTGDRRSAYRDLAGIPKGKRQRRKPRRRWQDNIKTNQVVGWKGMDWIHVA